MKIKTIILLLVCGFIWMVRTVDCQDTKKVQEPEYLGVFMALGENGDLRALERQTAESKIKIKAFGYGGGEGYLQINGDRSPVRFTADAKFQFVVLVASQQNDPMSLIQFYSFEAAKGIRRLTLTKVGSMGMSSKNTTNQNAVSFNAAKYGASSFKITPAFELKPGEYCLSTSTTATAFCFGVDVATTP